MIRINLLPVREARKQAVQRKHGALFFATVIVAAVCCMGVHVWMGSRIAEEQQAIAAAQAELQSLQEIQKQVDAYTAEREEIEKKLQVIATLEAGRTGPVRILDEIASRIPQRVWLTRLSAREGRLEMEGLSLDAEIVATFLTNLEGSPLFGKVELQETLLEEHEGLKVNSFKVTSSYPFSVAALDESDGGQPGRAGRGGRR